MSEFQRFKDALLVDILTIRVLQLSEFQNRPGLK